MRYASRNDGAPAPAPLHVSIDALLEEARRVEREKVLLEVRREIGAVPVTTPRSGYSYSTDERSARDFHKDAMSIIDRKLAQ